MILLLIDMEKRNVNNFGQWWNDGENKLQKIIKLFVSWWDDGNNKLLKAIYFSLSLHLLFGFAWLIFSGINYLI